MDIGQSSNAALFLGSTFVAEAKYLFLAITSVDILDDLEFATV